MVVTITCCLALATFSQASGALRANEFPASRFPHSPPPAHTGGFNEPTCEACHFGEPLNDAPGALEVLGFPERYVPGSRYDLRIRLRHPELRAAGFQAAVRSPDGQGGSDAGTLEPLDDRVSATLYEYVTYLSQSANGAAATDSAEWKISWTAPASRTGVVLNVAGNAADGDASQFGDRVYSLELRSEMQEPGEGRGAARQARR